jgi:glutathione synthase/RimK-type ligase-like ATP-grasp enzyme
LAWLQAAQDIARKRNIDVLLPTQEQVAVLSLMHASLGVATVVPAFKSLCRVQDKISAYRTLLDLDIPQPDSIVAKCSDELRSIAQFPVFVKRPISTASAGVRKASSESELAAMADLLGCGRSEVLVQTAVSGQLAMVQAVADNGRLVAHHACLRVREGVGGGAAIKESVAIPGLPVQLERLSAALHWHGPLSMDVIVSEQGPLVIDINPRLVEPMNAYLSGVDLIGSMLDLALERRPRAQSLGKSGVRSHQLLLAILGAAEFSESRIGVARELLAATGRRGEYAGSVEELTPFVGDLLAVVPLLVASMATLAWPRLWRSFHAGAVGPYSLTPQAWQDILEEWSAQQSSVTHSR